MKTAALTCILLIVMILSSAAASRAEVESHSAASMEVDQVTTVYGGGAVFVNQTILFRNRGTGALTSVKVGLPANFSDRIKLLEACEAGGGSLPVEHEGLAVPGIYGLKILVPRAILPGETFIVTIHLLLSRLLSPAQQGYSLELLVHPALEGNISRMNATVIFPRQLTLTTIPSRFNRTTGSEGTILHMETTDIPSYSLAVEKVTFLGAFELFEVAQFRRMVFLSGEGDVHVEDSYLVGNPGTKKLTSVGLLLPRNASEVTAHDSLGKLETAFGSTAQGTPGTVTVTLRNELDTDEQAEVSVEYRLVTAAYVTATGLGSEYQVTMEWAPGINTTVKECSLTVKLPEGAELAKVNASSLSWERSQEFFTQAISWGNITLTPIETFQVSFTYRYLPLWAAFRPSLLGGVLLAVGLGIFLSRRRIAPVPVAPAVPTALITSVVNALDERVRLRRESERITRDFAERRLSRSAYRERMGVISRRRVSVERTLAQQVPQLRETGDRYAATLSRIEEAEAEAEAARVSIEELRRRYRDRAMSREVYERMLRDYERRFERAEASVDRLAQSLKQEAAR